MGNSYAGQMRTTRFEEVLHNSIEASLRSNVAVPPPVFSQLYLEIEKSLAHDGERERGGGVENRLSSNVHLQICLRSTETWSVFLCCVSSKGRAEVEDDDEEDGSEDTSPQIPYQMKPPPEGCCTTEGLYTYMCNQL